MIAPQIAAYGQSHIGKVRSDNQDSIGIYEPEHEHGYLYAIADGMGGYEHGGVASTQAVEAFVNAFYGGNPAKASQNMRQGIQAANLAVFQMSQRLAARMGTTLSAANFIGRQLNIAHVGDSRIYLIRGGESRCLTNDHTAVGELVRLRVLSPDKVRKHERRSMLEKCLGMQLFVQPDIHQHTLYEDDYIILCTDGVWAYVEDDEFAQIVFDIKNPQEITQALVEVAMERDSDDNLSAVVIQVQHLTPEPADERHGWGITQLLRGRLTGKV